MTKRSGGTLKSARSAYSIQTGRKRGRYARGRTVAWLVIGTMAAVGLLGGAVAAQTEPDEAEPVPVAISAEDPETAPSCAGTAAVERSTTSEDLIHDCETLLAARGVLDTHGGRLNWSTELRMRQWTGIRLDRSRAHVASIDLPFRGLEGSVPPALADLTEPTFIRLSYNSLTGPIPPELGNLTTLEQLHLGNNELTGSIPPELSNLSALTHLQLDRNDLTGLIPPELGLLKALRSLRLGFNRLAGCIPSALYESPRFSIDPSTAVGIPLCAPAVCTETTAVGKSTTDVRLIMDCDSLLDAKPVLDPGEVLNWSTKVAIGDWDGVQIIDSAYGPRVGSLDLRSRTLTGSVPAPLSHLSALSNLDLSGNLLTGPIPAEVGNLSGLGVLNLDNNLLTGSIPAELGKLVSLTGLYLFNNGLTGAIPPELGDLSALTALVLSDNLLTGSIPPELGKLTRLTRLGLDDNRLTGTIPPDLGNLTELELLGLDNNRLTGTIPPELAQLGELTLLLLGENELTGCIPPNVLEDTQNDLDTLELPSCEDEQAGEAGATAEAGAEAEVSQAG